LVKFKYFNAEGINGRFYWQGYFLADQFYCDPNTGCCRILESIDRIDNWAIDLC
jgi:hypothetical protein